jgi:hypothetical protein
VQEILMLIAGLLPQSYKRRLDAENVAHSGYDPIVGLCRGVCDLL